MDARGDLPDLKKIRSHCELLVRGLRLPEPFDLEAFCDLLAEERRRPIVLEPVAGLGPHTQGAWIETPTADLIVYERRTTPLHQEHIVLHELSHIICEHKPPASDLSSAGLFPDLGPELVQRALQRHAYTNREEIEAEVLASLIRERVEAGREPAVEESDPALARRLEAFRQGEPAT